VRYVLRWWDVQGFLSFACQWFDISQLNKLLPKDTEKNQKNVREATTCCTRWNRQESMTHRLGGSSIILSKA
jgi:hypothetical protein